MEQDENGNWLIRVPLIGRTKERLEALVAEIGDICPVTLAASMLHDLLEDDEDAHLSPEDVVGESLKSVH